MEEFFKTRTKKRILSCGEIISSLLLLRKEREIIYCKNECTYFYKRGSRERSSFVRSRVKQRIVTCELAIFSTGYFCLLDLSSPCLPEDKVLKKLEVDYNRTSDVFIAITSYVMILVAAFSISKGSEFCRGKIK